MIMKNCNKCGKRFVSYSSCNDTCDECFRESHKGQYNNGGKQKWRKILNLLNLITIILLIVPLALSQECSGKIIERDGKLLCLTCNEGFELSGDSCELIKNPSQSQLSFIDMILYKYFPSNPLLGLIIIVILVIEL